MNCQLLIYFLFILGMSTLRSSVSEAQTAPDSSVIQAVIEDYVVGWREADTTKLNRAFEVNEGRIMWISATPEGEVLGSMTFETVLEQSKKQPSYGSKWEILNLDVVENKLAVAKVFISTKKGHYIDYLILQKISEQWKIVTKTYVYKTH